MHDELDGKHLKVSDNIQTFNKLKRSMLRVFICQLSKNDINKVFLFYFKGVAI